MARTIPPSLRHESLIAINALHTALFLSIGAGLLLTLWDGLRGPPARRTAMAGGIVAVESLVYVSNNPVCPVTPLAEEVGSERVGRSSTCSCRPRWRGRSRWSPGAPHWWRR